MNPPNMFLDANAVSQPKGGRAQQILIRLLRHLLDLIKVTRSEVKLKLNLEMLLHAWFCAM